MRRNALKILAAGRRHRLRSSARPKFDLAAEEIERSTMTAMRLADASKPQVEARANADATQST
jgi:hypothetical protein